MVELRTICPKLGWFAIHQGVSANTIARVGIGTAREAGAPLPPQAKRNEEDGSHR
jgi:hypothetical protein